MRNKVKYGFQRLHGCAWIAWDIDNQTAAKGSGNGAAHGSKRSMVQSFTAHLFPKPIQDALANHSCGLWRDIAGGNTGASRCDHQSGLASLLAQRGGNPGQVIGNNQVTVHNETGLLQAMDDLRPGAVGAKAAKTGVADGNVPSVHICDSTLLETTLGRA